MIKIQKHGSFLFPNSEGFIEPVFPEMQKEWKIIVDKTVEYYRTDFGDKIHSIYVRGSVAKGQVVSRNLNHVSDAGSIPVTSTILNINTNPNIFYSLFLNI